MKTPLCPKCTQGCGGLEPDCPMASKKIDTSAEAIKGSAALLCAIMTPLLHSERLKMACLIESLAAERDALRGDLRLTSQQCGDFQRQMERALFERDAARAEAARLREALEEIERGHVPSMPMAEVVDDLVWTQMWVGQLRKIARAALAQKDAGND
jgi:hypothetical protein